MQACKAGAISGLSCDEFGSRIAFPFCFDGDGAALDLVACGEGAHCPEASFFLRQGLRLDSLGRFSESLAGQGRTAQGDGRPHVGCQEPSHGAGHGAPGRTGGLRFLGREEVPRGAEVGL